MDKVWECWRREQLGEGTLRGQDLIVVDDDSAQLLKLNLVSPEEPSSRVSSQRGDDELTAMLI